MFNSALILSVGTNDNDKKIGVKLSLYRIKPTGFKRTLIRQWLMFKQ